MGLCSQGRKIKEKSGVKEQRQDEESADSKGALQVFEVGLDPPGP